MKTALTAAVLPVILLVAACADDDPDAPAGTVDAVSDTVLDDAADSEPSADTDGEVADDPAVEVEPDVEADVAGDVIDDTADDTAADSSADAPTDGSGDVTDDTQVDTADDTDSDTTTDPDSDTTSDSGSGSCTSSDECAPDGWCRDLEPVDGVGESTCVPYRLEGESCGGHTLPWYFERCKPEYVCMDADVRLADAPGRCLTSVTVAQLAAAPEAYDGLLVGLDGVTGAVRSFCTLRACTPEAPCCNTCVGSEALFDEGAVVPHVDPSVLLVSGDGEDYACSGTNCDPAETCTQPAGETYRVIGVFDAERGAIVVQSMYPHSFL